MEKIKVLLVDDEAELGDRLKSILEERWDRHAVTLARSGEGALELLRKENFDVLVTDIRMPPPDGIELLKKGREIRKYLETIMISGHGDFEHAIEALQLGADNYLAKPVPADALHYAIVKAWEKRKARKDLRKSEKQYRMLFESVPVGIGIADSDGAILKYNSHISQMLGYASDEIAKVNVREFYANPCERNILLGELLERGRVSDWEVKLKRRDGSVFDALVNIQPIEFRNRQVLLTSIRDITAANIAKNSMKRRLAIEELISTVSTRFISVGIEKLDTEIRRFLREIGEFTGSDRVYINLFEEDGETVETGYEWCAKSETPWFSRIKGVSIDSFPWVAEKLRMYRTVCCADVSALGPVAEREKKFCESIPIRSFVILPMIINNRLGGFMGIDSGHTQKTPSDEDMRMLSVLANIFANVFEREKAEQTLKRAIETAEFANRAKSDFLAKMSHELRTPLNGILGYTQILKNDGGLTEKQGDAVDIIRQSGEHLLILITDILDLAKIEAGKTDLVLSDFHLFGFLRSIIDISRVRANEKQIGFNCIFPPNLPPFVRGDEKHLRQVLLNLLGNAVKFTEKGHVSFAVVHYRGRFQFSVSDTGIGIPREKLADIFLPFHQVAGNCPEAEGTGMGLAISRELVKMMGGDLTVQSVLGEGSIFRFELDLPAIQCEPENTVKPVCSKIVGYLGDRKKALIVDDLADNRKLVRDALASLGFDTREANGGRDAVNKNDEYHPDLILMDLVMPDLDGFEAIRLIRNKMTNIKPAIIAVSADVTEETKKKASECGADDFVPKPIDFDELLGKIGVYLNLKWRCETDGNEPPENDLCAPEKAIKPPPMSEIEKLGKMAGIGDLDGIGKWLETCSPEYSEFCGALRALTQSFQTRRIKEFINRHL